MTDKEEMDAYKQGLIEGRLISLEKAASEHEARIEKAHARISVLEKSAYALMGAVAIMQFIPELKGLLQ